MEVTILHTFWAILLGIMIGASLQFRYHKKNQTNLVYNKEFNQIGIILFEGKNQTRQKYYRVNMGGIWSKENCIRLNRKQCNTLLTLDSASWRNMQKPDLKILGLC